MYYKIKVYSAEDSTKRNDFFVKETLPYVDRKVLEEFFRRATCYQVKVTPLPHVTQLKKKYKAWDSIDLERHISDIRFYTLKEHEVKEWITIATFYKQPCHIEVADFMDITYTFFKEPNKYTTSIEQTLIDCNIPYRISKKGDPFTWEEYAFALNPRGHCDLIKLVGTHTEYIKERLYS